MYKKFSEIIDLREFFVEWAVKIDILSVSKNAAAQQWHPNRNPAKRLRFGKEEQRRERALTYKISRSKRYKACSDVERGTGVEPAYSAWEADALPMY